MKKKLIIAAIGAALAAGSMVANAAPTVYGKMHVSIDKFDNGGVDAVLNRPDGINVASNSSRVGVKGTEDLGGGLAAAYQAEFGFNADEDGGLVSQRNSYVGLAGGFGTILAGRHDSPYKLATAALDPFSETVGDYNAVVGNTVQSAGVFDLRVSNAIAYISPAMGGVTVIGAYVVAPISSFLGNALAQANGADVQDVTAISLAALYGAGPLSVSVAYESHSVDDSVATLLTTGKLSHKAMKAGAGYDFGVVKIAAVYEKTSVDDKTTIAGMERNALWGSVTAPFGNNAVSLAYGKLDESEAAAGKDGATLLSVGFFHNFSKTTKAYAVYATMDNDDNATFALGTSGHGDIVSAVAGQKEKAISLGMSVDF